ncbi:MAG: hypothetical protein R6V55_05395, partial [Desulfovermiculus sp.]
NQDLSDYEARARDEIPEDTPHFLNPQALAGEEADAEDAGEEHEEDESFSAQEVEATTYAHDNWAEEHENIAAGDDQAVAEPGAAEKHEQGPDRDNAAGSGREGTQNSGQSPERMQEVLNQGLEFMSGILEMATGQKLHKTEEDKPMLTVDSQTGEVTMKFKLPGF